MDFSYSEYKHTSLTKITHGFYCQKIEKKRNDNLPNRGKAPSPMIEHRRIEKHREQVEDKIDSEQKFSKKKCNSVIMKQMNSLR